MQKRRAGQQQVFRFIWAAFPLNATRKYFPIVISWYSPGPCSVMSGNWWNMLVGYSFCRRGVISGNARVYLKKAPYRHRKEGLTVYIWIKQPCRSPGLQIAYCLKCEDLTWRQSMTSQIAREYLGDLFESAGNNSAPSVIDPAWSKHRLFHAVVLKAAGQLHARAPPSRTFVGVATQRIRTAYSLRVVTWFRSV